MMNNKEFYCKNKKMKKMKNKEFSRNKKMMKNKINSY